VKGDSDKADEIRIRTRDAGFPTYRTSNPAIDCHKSLTSQQLAENQEGVLPSCLPKTAENGPDLRAVVEAWPSLSDPMKRAILALVNAADAGAGVADRST
jgi:hypothetical protein